MINTVHYASRIVYTDMGDAYREIVEKKPIIINPDNIIKVEFKTYTFMEEKKLDQAVVTMRDNITIEIPSDYVGEFLLQCGGKGAVIL